MHLLETSAPTDLAPIDSAEGDPIMFTIANDRVCFSDPACCCFKLKPLMEALADGGHLVIRAGAKPVVISAQRFLAQLSALRVL